MTKKSPHPNPSPRKAGATGNMSTTAHIDSHFLTSELRSEFVMSAVPTGIPPLIEQQLLVLDKQIRDAAFVRGSGRLVLGISIFLGCGLLLDAFLGLNGTIRGMLLAAWFLLAFGLLWRNVIRPMFAPVSLASLAALVEQQFPELRERLTSLVELRGSEGTELAPGASKLMQDLLARQTLKAFNQLSLDRVTFQRGPLRTALCAAAAVVLLITPFAWNRDGYGLLLGRFFVPWGNFSWGADLELVVVEGDQVVARGSDVPIHVSVNSRRRLKSVDPDKISPLRLNWRDVSNASDQRRFVWDAETSTFVTTLPHVQHSLTFDVTTDGARTGIHRINVADPPVMTRFQMEIEPAAYTGLPARSLASVPAEIRMPELSHVLINVEFNEPVVEAQILWPVPSQEKLPPLSPLRRNTAIEESIPFKLSPDHRRGTAEVVARVTGPIAIRATNSSGLQNAESPRTLFVTTDEPPEIRLAGPDKPVFVRPDDHFEQSIEVYDDYGLTAVELHVEPSTGPEQIETLSADLLRDRPLIHTLTIDLSKLNLSGGQIVTYRIRAVDNRHDPAPQETWTPPRTLMVNTSLPQLPDQELAAEKQQLEDELVMLRAELNDSKEAMTKLHQQVEKESLGREPQSEKSEQLDALQNEQDSLLERLQKLGDRLAERQMTQELAALTDQIAEEDLKIAQERLEQARNKPSRDQLEPIAQAIDRNGAAEKKLQRLERQLNELNKLEQDLSELSRLAQRAERLADELEKLDQELEESKLRNETSLDNHPQAVVAKEQSKEMKPADDAAPNKPLANSKPAEKTEPIGADSAEPNSTAQLAAKPPATTSATDSEKEQNRGEDSNQTDAESLRKLKEEGDKLSKQMDELLKKHPELLDAAKRDQQDRLNQLAEQSKQLAEAQSRLSETLKREADNAPAIASRPENRPSEDLKSEDLKPENPPSEDASREDPKSIDSKNASPPKPEQPQQSKKPNGDSTDKPDSPAGQQDSQIAESPNPPDASKASPTSEGERGQSALKRQEQITREATKQALDLARETGADSPATKSAADFARKAEQARQQAQAGQLAQAAEAAGEAEKASEETRQQLNPDGQSKSPQASQARKLAEQQREAASELQELAQSPEAVRGAQREGQRQLAAATSKLTEKLEDAARALKSTPLNASHEASQVAESAEKARQATEQAEQAMQQSERANSQQDPQRSAAAAAKAADKLQKAAGEVPPTPPRPQSATPVPKELGAKVADATRQVKAAQQQLEQCDCPNPTGGNGSKTGTKSGSGSPPSASASQSDSSMQQGTANANESSQRPAGRTERSGQGQSESESQATRPSNSTEKGPTKGKSGEAPSEGQVVADNNSDTPSVREATAPAPKKPSAEEASPTPPPGSDPPSNASATAHTDGSEKSGQRTESNGEPDDTPNSDAAKESQLATAAEQFKQFAKLLKAASQSAKESRPKSRSPKETPLARSILREPSSNSKSGESGEMAQETTEAPDLSHLEIELQQQTRQNWGRLPGKLRTEILQGAGKKSHPEYTQRIKSYFDEITKPAK